MMYLNFPFPKSLKKKRNILEKEKLHYIIQNNDLELEKISFSKVLKKLPVFWKFFRNSPCMKLKKIEKLFILQKISKYFTYWTLWKRKILSKFQSILYAIY
jgi:hypothetical protein